MLPLQAPVRTVTVESPGISVKALVQEIGRQSGQSLEAGPSVASDLLIARIHDVKVSDAMKMLSVVEVGKWSPKNGVTTFSKDGDEVEKRQAAEKAKLVKGWADKIAQFASRMGPPKYDAQWASSFADRYKELVARRNAGDVDDFVRLEEAKYALPAERAMVRLFQLIGPEKLAENPNGFVEYATAANSLQIPLDAGAMEILKDWQSEEAVWGPVSQGKFGGKGLGRGSAPVDLSQATGLLLQLATHAHSAGGVVTLTAYDRNGVILKQELSPLMVGAGKAMADERLQDQEDLAHPRWVELPTLSYKLYRVRDEQPKAEVVLDWWNHDPEFKRAILNPDKVNYTAEILGRQALAMADERGENLLIPEIPTMARFLPSAAFKDGKMNANALRTALQRSRTPVDLPNWFVVSPLAATQEFLEGQGMVNPHDLGEFVRGVVANSSIQIDSYAELIKDTDGAYGVGGDFGIIETVMRAVEPDLPGLGWLNDSTLQVAFYGTLNESFRDQARTSQGLGISSMSADNWRPLLKNPLMLQGLTVPASVAGGRETIFTDPYVFFDSVNARKGTLKIVDGEGTSVMVERDGYERYIGASEWAEFVKGRSQERSNDTKYRAASRKWIKIMIDFDGKASLKFQLNCDTGYGAPAKTYEGLSQEFRDRVASAQGGG